MSTLTGEEPELELGASGEHVQQLQDRLRGLKLLDKFPDGTYDDLTEAAVRQFQSDRGIADDGKVTQETWQVLDQHMLDYGLQYNPYAGPGQQHWDLEPAGTGEHLMPHEATHTEQQGQDSAYVEPYWDGQQWLQYDAQAGEWLPMPGQDAVQTPAAATAPAAGAAADEAPVVPHIDNIHPAIRDDERFTSFHEFLRETHGS